MTKRHAAIALGSVFVLAFFLQALWESPIRPTIAWITDPGCRLAWYIATPDYSRNASVWRFDLIAVGVNTLVYSAAYFAGAFFLRRIVRQR
jgi:hypothetical protein